MRKRIFIGSSSESLHISYVIQENFENDFKCTVWDQDSFEYGIFVFSPDDKVITRNEEFDAIRDNTLFEFGLFVGRLGRENTLIPLAAIDEIFRYASYILKRVSGLRCHNFVSSCSNTE